MAEVPDPTLQSSFRSMEGSWGCDLGHVHHSSEKTCHVRERIIEEAVDRTLARLKEREEFKETNEETGQ